MTKPTPTNTEAQFDLSELFFSTTDSRGIIQVGNSVFQRISQYSSEELIGQPHNIIRHPDMPKTVFWLLWETIKSGKPIVAYVKNMAKDGSYYWVLASVFPLKKSYLSVRIKPTSAIFGYIPDLYKKMCTAEIINQGNNPIEAGKAILMETLNSLGYSNYETFMTDVLTTELQSRENLMKNTSVSLSISSKNSSSNTDDSALLYKTKDLCHDINQHCASLFANLGRFSKLGSALSSKAKIIVRMTEKISTAALNTTIQASRIGALAASMSVISNELTESSEQLKGRVEKIGGDINSMKDSVHMVQFNMSVVKLMIEMINFFFKEWTDQPNETTDIKVTQEYLGKCFILVDILTQYLKQSMGHLLKFVDQSSVTGVGFASLGRLVMALEIIRKTGMIESVKLGAYQLVFGDLFNEMTYSISTARNEISGFAETLVGYSDIVRQTKEGTKSVIIPPLDNLHNNLSRYSLS